MAQAKRFKSDDVRKLYMQTYKDSYQWNDLLPTDIYNYLQLLYKANDCPITLSMAGLVPLCAAICGPNTKMSLRDGFDTVLNMYTMAVSVPGGGKSVIYGKLSEVNDAIEYSFNKTILIENYSSAGLQKQQNENGGYALLSSDEGHQILNNLNQKQQRNEGERAILNKLWGGRGDSTILKDGARGFKNTSFSMAVFIQPSVCLSEMSHMMAEDGFFDRIMIFVEKPKLHLAATSKVAINKLRNYPSDSITKLFCAVFDMHQNDTVYRFDDAAQEMYDNMADDHAREFNRLYPSESEEDDTETEDRSIAPYSSKDHIIIARLAAILHILTNGFKWIASHEDTNAQRKTRSAAKQMPETFEVPALVPLDILQRSQQILLNSRKQKIMFMESLTNVQAMEYSLKPVASVKKRVVTKVATYPGPCITPREIARCLHLVDTAMARAELVSIDADDFGKMNIKGQAGWTSNDIFFKPHPDSLDAANPTLQLADIDCATYQAYYNNVSKVTPSQRRLLLQHHPHNELLNDILTANSTADSTQ